jgi:hypothetical protein
MVRMISVADVAGEVQGLILRQDLEAAGRYRDRMQTLDVRTQRKFMVVQKHAPGVQTAAQPAA